MKNKNSEIKEVTICEEATSKDEKPNALGKFIQGTKSIGKSVGKGALNVATSIKKNTIDKAKESIDESKRFKQINTFFESKATTFFIEGRTIYGIKGELGSNNIIFRADDAPVLGAGIEIQFDKQILEITDIDKKNIFNFVYNNETYDLPCFKAIFRIKEKQASPQTIINQINNTVSLAENSTFNGDIQQVAQTNNDLQKVESAINNFKHGILTKGKKEEAQKMFATFKSAVNNEITKDKSFFDKFIKILAGIVPPTIVSIAQSLWG